MSHACLTPIIKTSNNVFLKLEFLHVGRSHKARAAVGILNRAEASGDLVRNGGATIIEKTGGNLGIALAIEGISRGYNVELVVGLLYSQKKRRLLRKLGAKLIGITELKAGLTPKSIINNRIIDDKFSQKKYVYLDQFTDQGSYQGHLDTLAPELYSQLIDNGVSTTKTINLIVGAGTGASAAAVFNYLTKMQLKVNLHLVQPAGCSYRDDVFISHVIEGIAVGGIPPFLDLNLVTSYIDISNAEAIKGQNVLLRNFGLFAGISSGANYMAIQKYLAANKSSQEEIIVSLLYDRGEDY